MPFVPIAFFVPCFSTTGSFILHPTEAFTTTKIDAHYRDARTSFTRFGSQRMESFICLIGRILLLTFAPDSHTFSATDSSGDAGLIYSEVRSGGISAGMGGVVSGSAESCHDIGRNNGMVKSTFHAPSSILSPILCALLSSTCSRMPGEVELGTDESGLVWAPSRRSAGRSSHTGSGALPNLWWLRNLLLTLVCQRTSCCAGDNASGGAPTSLGALPGATSRAGGI